MELIGNLEVLKVGDYVKAGVKTALGYYNKSDTHICKITQIKKKEILGEVLARISETEEGKEKLLFWEKSINTFVVDKHYKKQKKKKLKGKKYSYSNQVILFRLNKREIDKIIKEAILRRLED